VKQLFVNMLSVHLSHRALHLYQMTAMATLQVTVNCAFATSIDD